VVELLPAARDIGQRALHLERHSLVHLLAGLRVPGHEAGHDERLRLCTRLRQPALDEQDVQSLAHRRKANDRRRGR
jgi:hypothetical protein